MSLLKDIIKKTTQVAIYMSLPAAITTGSLIGNGDDSFIPFYSHKTEDVYGINFAIYTKIDPGVSVNGANISLYNRNHGTINGLELSLLSPSGNESKINGGRISLVAGPDFYNDQETIKGIDIGLGRISRTNVEGLQLSLANMSSSTYYGSGSVKGAQIGLINLTGELKGTQIGLYNQTNKNKSALINVNNKRKK